MALSPADFLLPPAGTGELDPAWWGTGTLEDDLLPVWLTSGEGQVPSGATSEQGDAVILAYVYATAYDAKLRAMATTPNTMSVDSGDVSVGFSSDQRKIFATEANKWWLRFAEAVDDAAPAAIANNPPRTSSSVQAVVHF